MNGGRCTDLSAIVKKFEPLLLLPIASDAFGKLPGSSWLPAADHSAPEASYYLYKDKAGIYPLYFPWVGP
jgi:Na+-transporting methylmalonyl-CoA/oxaloacetate decarboxylase beta subunit